MLASNAHAVPPNDALLHQLLRTSVQSIVSAASSEETKRRLAQWATELSTASASALLIRQAAGPHADCERHGRCIAKGSGRCLAGRESRPTGSTNPTALLANVSMNHATSTQAAVAVLPQAAAHSLSEDTQEDGQKEKRRKLSSAEPWSLEEEIALLDLIAEMPKPPKFKAEYEALAVRLGTGRSGPAVKQHGPFEFLASQVVSKLPTSYAARHESHAIPFKVPAWCDLGLRPTASLGSFCWDEKRRVYDRLQEAMKGAQPQRLQFDSTLEDGD